MGISYGSTDVGNVRAANVSGRGGVGISELAFSLVWSMQPKREEKFAVFGTSAWISVQADPAVQPILLGQAMPEVAWCTESRDFATNDHVLFRLILPNPQLLALEQIRQGRSLAFTISVRGNCYGPQGVRGFDDTLTLHVNVSDWTRVLREANVADVLLVGIHMPTDDLDPGYRGAIALVRKANQHLTQGDFSVAVAECRRALESLWKAAKLAPRALKARQQSSGGAERQSMSKKDRELALGEAIKHLCHNAHHVGADAVPEEFGRLDAALVVGGTAALISSLIASPDLVETPPVVVTPAVPIPKPAKASAAVPRSDGGLAEQVQKAVAYFKRNGANCPRTEKTLHSCLASLFAQKLQSAEIDTLIAELKSKKIIEEKAKKLSYPGV